MEILDLAARLRLSTSQIHTDLESKLKLASPDLCLHDYRAILSRFFGLYSAWEPAAHRAAGDPSLTAKRRKLPLLASDLAALSVDAATLPVWPGDPRLDSEAAALGAMYVMEGATLGGQVIGRNLTVPHSFFTSYGAETGRMWRAFREHLVSRSSPDFDHAAVTAAVRTFSVFRDWLTRDGIT